MDAMFKSRCDIFYDLSAPRAYAEALHAPRIRYGGAAGASGHQFFFVNRASA